ncbi:glutamate 5-kinase [Brucella neotomae]|uniref:Glutamate 5-kinase n=1 Tax=Brucella neotomae 5K33 TaxID=520456 RepID=A0A7U8PYG4_BRUNE|nr:glutamate 5-kinase [Brucella neotomae]EEY05349.1 glutamate 5-kinase [Brucella neotomae 5K33]KEX96842.1 glutamate 5-kinase [Brucella neotomae 5K33]KFJ55171.1 glutamate 5-kinase [Brucella neotomae 5K33]SPU67129.1 glutamate 5-kinase [Brucella neotomae]SPU68930.1 glutamate 5-kinase [Brucella neotomae]
MLKKLKDYRRIVVKIGSALLVDRATGLKREWLESLGQDIAALQHAGVEVLVVSSGAIALGRTVLGLPKKALKLEESQAAAAAGQIALAKAYADVLGGHGIKSGQILVTLSDTEERRRYLNARATIETLLKLKAVPIINENDTVATTEIRYGDNDRLAARVATMMGADLLILLSDIDGLYTAPPHKNPDAQFLPFVETITPQIEAMAGAAASELSRGGMKTKLDAGKIANAAGTAMIITSGTRFGPLSAIDRGERATLFGAAHAPVNAWKTWISGNLEPAGRLTVDAGAVKALKSGKSLLPAGVKEVDGDFERGDTVAVMNEDGREIARGLIAYDAADARKVAGHKSDEISAILGYDARAAMIHRNDLVVRAASDAKAA